MKVKICKKISRVERERDLRESRREITKKKRRSSSSSIIKWEGMKTKELV